MIRATGMHTNYKRLIAQQKALHAKQFVITVMTVGKRWGFAMTERLSHNRKRIRTSPSKNASDYLCFLNYSATNVPILNAWKKDIFIE